MGNDQSGQTHDAGSKKKKFLAHCIQTIQSIEVISKCCFLSLSLSMSVLSIHKRPTSTSSNFTFPAKGWRGMLDWVRTSEEKISVSRDALSLEQTGKTLTKETKRTLFFFRSTNVQSYEFEPQQVFCSFQKATRLL